MQDADRQRGEYLKRNLIWFITRVEDDAQAHHTGLLLLLESRDIGGAQGLDPLLLPTWVYLGQL